MRKVYMALMGVMVAAIALQFYLAAAGAFSEAPKDESFRAHALVGMGIFAVAILATVAAAIARLPRRITLFTLLIVGLVIVQTLFRVIADGFAAMSPSGAMLVFGIHGVNGLAIMALAGTQLRAARNPDEVTAPRAPVTDPYGP